MTYRDHASYLQEWVEFHRLVGIERFYLYDNGSTDDHEEVLRPYIDEGIVVLHKFPGAGQRYAALDHCVATYRDEARWIAFFDVDEFLFSPAGTPVPDVLPEFEGWPGVGVNEAMFGTSGHLTRPSGLVIENYVHRRNRRQPEGDPGFKSIVGEPLWIKSIVDPKRTLHCVGGHTFVYEQGHAVDVLKRPIEVSYTESFCLDVLRLNHYYTKSLEELQAKWATPRPDNGELRDPHNMERLLRAEPDGYLLDETIQMYVPQLKAALR
jgi:hypothetical protein